MSIFSMSVTDIIVRVCAVFVCLTFHELAHGYTAYLLGDTTAQRQGRLSISPMAHIDPVGLLCLFVAGIGWAKPVPVNPGMFRMKNKQLGMAITAAAGPLTNFAMSYVCMLVYILLSYFVPGAFTAAINAFLHEIAILGIGLGVFNLIPIPPLDGSKILMMFLPYRAVDWMYKNEGYIRFGFLIIVVLNLLNKYIAQAMYYIQSAMLRSIIWLIELVGLI